MVSGAPRSNLYEIDNTQIWTEQSGLGVYLGLPAKAGSLTPQYIPNLQTLKDEYTVSGSFSADDDPAFAVAKRIVNTTGLGLIVNRVANDDVLYGGCTIPCGTSRTASALNIGLANPQDITFVNASTVVAEECDIQFRSDVNGNMGGTAFYLPGQTFIISFKINATQEVNTYTVINPDIEGGLNNKFMLLPNNAGYVWFNVDGTGVNPGNSTLSLQGLTGYQATISKNATQDVIVSAIVTALSGVSGLTVVAQNMSITEGNVNQTYNVVADDNGSLNDTYMILPLGDSYIWFNVNSEGTDPGTTVAELANLTGYEIAIATNATVSTIIETISSVLSNVNITVIATNMVKITVQSAGVTPSGNAGSSGFRFMRPSIGYNEIKAYKSTSATVKEVTIERNMNANNVATAVFETLTTDADLIGAFTSSIDVATDNLITVVSKVSGIMPNATIVEESPAPVLIRTVKQGSSKSGSDVLFLYFNNPSEKANKFGIKLYNSEDYPNIAPQEGTFVIEVYTKSNPRTPISTVTCSRNPALVDSYNNTMYVTEVLQNLTKIRAIDNTEVPSSELPQSITDILWFGGGDSGSTPTLANYIDAVQPMVDRELYAISLLLPGGYYADAYLQELDRIAAKRGEAVLITGVRQDYENSANYLTLIPQWMNDEVLLTDSYAAVFSPSVIAYDSDMGRNITLPVETCVAEQIAFANENYSISEPILGFARGTLQNVLGVTRRYSFSDDGTEDGDVMYDNRVNPIRYFNNQGYVIWGQKTTQRTSSARDRLNVRLMLTALKPLLNQVQLGLVGELPTQATRKRAQGLLKSIFDVGVARNWFKEDYSVELVEDPTLEAQHIQRINYTILPYNAIEYIQGYIILENGVVSTIA